MAKTHVDNNYQVKETEWNEINCLAIRSVVDYSNMATFLADSYKKIDQAILNQGQIPGARLGIYYNPRLSYSEVAAAVPYQGDYFSLNEIAYLKIPPSKVCYINFLGNCYAVQPAYDTLTEFCKKMYNCAYPDLIVEEYIKTELNEKDTSKWEIKIHLLLFK